MFSKIRNSFLAATIALTSAIPANAAGFAGSDGTFYFRYKAPGIDNVSLPEPEKKDVTAFFVGGVDMEFSELLPLKPQWQDDTWSLKPGSILPAGITFNVGTRTFEGTPTTPVIDRTVELEGVDALGNTVARAEVHFDIHAIQGVPYHADIYAHTGKFKVDEMKLPAGVVADTWQNVYPLPSGVSPNGRFIQGTPTATGATRYMLFAKNYMGDVVATYWGNYLVEDGPTFNFAADWSDIRPLPINDTVFFSKKSPGDIFVKRAIDPSKAIKYFLEIDEAEGLPAGVTVQNTTTSNILVAGNVARPFETGKIRIKAIDSDATIGYSGWLTFGTGAPVLGCGVSGPAFELKTGKAVSMAPPAPTGTTGSVTFSLASGTLPEGLKLENNLIVGTPTKANQTTSANIASVVTTNGQSAPPKSCVLNFHTVPGNLALADSTPLQDHHVRVGKTYSGVAEVKGGQNPFEVKPSAGTLPVGFAFTTPTVDTSLVGVSGPATTVGATSIPLTLSNGDGNNIAGQLSYIGHGPLDTGVVPTISVQRLAASKVWGKVPYDEQSVIPDVSGANDYPAFVVSNAGGLPSGITLDQSGFRGATSSAAGSYGMHTVTMTDFEGKPVTSNSFEVVVTPREAIGVESLVEPHFTVRWGEQKATPLVVKQPEGAKNFRVDYALNNESPDPLPAWLSFDTSTAEMTASAQIPYADKRNWGPFTITATDQEGSTVTTEQFDIVVGDWPVPAANVGSTFKGNVSGNTAAGENATWLNIPGVSPESLRAFVLRNTVIGGPEKVVFTGSNPSKPAGLDFNAADGTFSGVPLSEFKGNVEVAFTDEEGREGTMFVPLEVRPYPTVRMTRSSYDVPRLANAALIANPVKAEAVSGFWNSPVWSVDLANGPDLPEGLTVNPTTGIVEGSTSADDGTVVSNIVLKAVSRGANNETLESRTAPFSIKVAKPAAITLAYDKSKVTYFLIPDGNGGYAVSPTNPAVSPVPTVGGSYDDPLKYSIDLAAALSDGMTGDLGINVDNGRLIGAPNKLGEWQIGLNVTDGGGRTPDDPVTLTVKATLDGFVNRSNGPLSMILRQDERFTTPALDVSNFVGNVVFSTIPAILADGLAFDTDKGAFLETSSFKGATSSYGVAVTAQDADKRGFEVNPVLSFKVIAPLTASATTPALSAKQYSTVDNGGIDATWSVTTGNVIKEVRYSIEGDLPGTLVYKTYDDSKAFLGWAWKDEDRNSQWIAASDPNASTLLPYDALVFDTLNPSLVGVASKAGSFGGLYIVARDLHVDDYAFPSPNQSEYNTVKLGPFAINVEAAAPFQAMASATSETIYRVTTAPTLRVNAVNAAAGRPVTWTLISGNLPDGVVQVKGDTSASFTGYATEKGSFPGLVWRARDAAGRTATADAQTLVVEERKGLELSAKPNPFGVVEGTALPAFSVNALNSALGKTIPASDWVLPTSGMPDGLTMSVANGRAVLSGTTSAVGDYSVPVSATDSLGATANVAVAISVLDEDEKIEVSSTSGRTKKGFPAQVQITADSRTFGDMRYVSGDTSVSVDATGIATAVYSDAGQKTSVVTVSDSTRRTTDHTISVDVIDELAIEVPTVYAVTGQQRTTQVSASNILGTVTYSKGDGNWPAGMTVDPATGEIGGTPTATGTFSGLTVIGDDTFVVGDKTYHDVRASNPFDVLVTSTPTGFALETEVSPSDVAAVIVNRPVEGLSVSAVNTAWDLPLTAGNWSVNKSAGLPPGVDFVFSGGKMVATGTPTALGTYGPFTFTATDMAGQKKTLTLSIRVITPEDAIVLNVSDIQTKVGFPISMQPSATNTYGKVTFYSYAIDGDPQTHVPGAYQGNLDINSATGLVTGSFPSLGDKTFDVYVSDATKRVTSQAVQVTVLPNLRLIYPDQVIVTQGEVASRTVDTSYAIGNVSYQMAAGQTLPDGLSLNATTGTISGDPTVEAGEYGPFTVVGIDGIGDRQYSNGFLIVVNPIQAYPVIANVTNNKLPFGTIGTPFLFTPTVTDSVKNKPWTYPARFTINHDLTPYGLTFDKKTGVISGTPTAPFYFDDVVITAASDFGNSATAPFVIGTPPALPMVATAGQTTAYTKRATVAMSIPTPSFDNTFGKLTYTATPVPAGTSFSSAGVLSGTPTTVQVVNTKVTVTDVFGRTATFDYSVDIKGALTLASAGAAQTAMQGVDYVKTFVPTATNIVGTATYTATGLPTGLSIDPATGAISGKIVEGAYESSTTFSVTVKVVDSFDAMEKSITYVITAPNPRGAHKVWVFQSQIGSGSSAYEAFLRSGTTNVGLPDGSGSTCAKLCDGNTTSSLVISNTGTTQTYFYRYATPKAVDNILVPRPSTSVNPRIRLLFSDDGTNLYWLDEIPSLTITATYTTTSFTLSW
ncbi:putative Ig domain-containing protein [Rhizobium sp. BK176]|uniref:putative Ig domain-containing protein n=1 Tax=Rhizobium sp. BK176 TaxID=2587071 RepID=UPI002169A7CE|nr:putative Ig domain-containing protein [Rhizobium sp. BK176]MCS4089112.1 hypothetical protein [Rhizobium sp. BK176]